MTKTQEIKYLERRTIKKTKHIEESDNNDDDDEQLKITTKKN
jgi:hypothetical protein